VSEVIREVFTSLQADETYGHLILEDPEIMGVDKFADSAVIIKGRIKTRPIRQWMVGREFNRRIKYAFDEKGIEIPFPHRSIYFGEASKPFAVEAMEHLAKQDREKAK
jgi:small conductance mechanosensitive channel